MENALRRTLTIVTKHPTAHDHGSAVPFLFAVDHLAGVDGGNIWTAEDIDRLRHSHRDGGGVSSSCGASCGSCGGGCGGG